MDILQGKLNECRQCPFEDYEINWYNTTLGTGKLGSYVYPNSNHSVLVVGQNPSHRRWKDEHAMRGRQGDSFREVFGLENLAFSNIIQVSTPDNKVDSLSIAQLNHCIDHFVYEASMLKPKLIIVCSSFGKKILTKLNREKDILKYCQNIEYVKHPDYYLTYRKEPIETYIKELKTIKEKYKV